MKDLGSIIADHYPNYKEYAMNHDLLTLDHFARLNKGDKINLAIFSFGYDAWDEFEFIFDRIEEPNSASVVGRIR